MPHFHSLLFFYVFADLRRICLVSCIVIPLSVNHKSVTVFVDYENTVCIFIASLVIFLIVFFQNIGILAVSDYFKLAVLYIYNLVHTKVYQRYRKFLLAQLFGFQYDICSLRKQSFFKLCKIMIIYCGISIIQRQCVCIKKYFAGIVFGICGIYISEYLFVIKRHSV